MKINGRRLRIIDSVKTIKYIPEYRNVNGTNYIKVRLLFKNCQIVGGPTEQEKQKNLIVKKAKDLFSFDPEIKLCNDILDHQIKHMIDLGYQIRINNLVI